MAVIVMPRGLPGAEPRADAFAAPEALGFARGLLVALAISAVFWAALGFTVLRLLGLA